MPMQLTRKAVLEGHARADMVESLTWSVSSCLWDVVPPGCQKAKPWPIVGKGSPGAPSCYKTIEVGHGRFGGERRYSTGSSGRVEKTPWWVAERQDELRIRMLCPDGGVLRGGSFEVGGLEDLWKGKCVCRVSGSGGVGTVETGNVRRGRAHGVRRGGPMSRVLNRVPPLLEP